MDTAALVAALKMLPNGDDLRIVYYNSSLGENNELPRQLFEMNSSTTDIWFELQAPIPSGVEAVDYFVYYGNPLAGPQPVDLIAAPVTLEFYEGDGNTLYQDAVLQCGVDADVNSDVLALATQSALQADIVGDGCDPFSGQDLVHLTLAEWANFSGPASWQVPNGARIVEDVYNPAGSRIRLWGAGETGSQVEASAVLDMWAADSVTWSQRMTGLPWAGNPGAGALLLGDTSADLLGFDGVSTEDLVTATMGNAPDLWGYADTEGPAFLFDYYVATLERWVTGRLPNNGLGIHVRASGLNDGVLWLSVEEPTIGERPHLTVVFYPHYQPEAVTSLGSEELGP